ncbi:MAG: DUF7687 domain-containing protein [Gammaproteobacteria bacterium]
MISWTDTLLANPHFLRQSKNFWAHVRTISQEVGYTRRGAGTILVPSVVEIKEAFKFLSLSTTHILHSDDTFTEFGVLLLNYFKFRAKVLNIQVRKNLMKKNDAQIIFNRLRKRLNPQCPLPMNKQKGKKRNYAFLTGIVNMLVEQNIGDTICDYDPRSLTTVTHKRMPLRTLARRVDGAFPSVVNPIAIWEIKEYYYTTTFGSRVADGVYETLLDGLELEELEMTADKKIQHLLIVDDYFTWWECGRSYLCRIVDMLHMGYLDEVIFGREVIKRMPVVVAGWKAEFNRRH